MLFPLCALRKTSSADEWYAAQVSDTTMLIHIQMLVKQKNYGTSYL